MFTDATNRLMKRQLAFMLARASIPITWLQPSTDEDGDADVEDELPDDVEDDDDLPAETDGLAWADQHRRKRQRRF